MTEPEFKAALSAMGYTEVDIFRRGLTLGLECEDPAGCFFRLLAKGYAGGDNAKFTYFLSEAERHAA